MPDSSPPPNPYSANPYAPSSTAFHSPTLEFEPAVQKKIEAVIKDANQFLLAILLCFLCSAVGMVLIGVWYLVRFLQWNALAKAYPKLMDPAAAPRSIAKRFQSAQWKLIVGMSFGFTLLIIFILAMTFVILSTRIAGN